MHKTFVDILLAESGKEGDNLNQAHQQGGLPVVLAEKVSAVFIFQLEDAGDRMFYPYGRVPE